MFDDKNPVAATAFHVYEGTEFFCEEVAGPVGTLADAMKEFDLRSPLDLYEECLISDMSITDLPSVIWYALTAELPSGEEALLAKQEATIDEFTGCLRERLMRERFGC